MHTEILEDLAKYSNDPLGFVYWAFPWGEVGTELETATGPEPWQIDVLKALEEGLLTIGEAIRIARTSGHGIGKSALVSWIVLWAISTFENTKGIVTANTENQLKTKTWAEVAKWHRNFIAKDMFKMTATALYSADPLHEKTWRVDMIPWSERNTEAFAGMHNKNSRILIIFDEASAIPDTIWEVTEGAQTDKNTQIIWVCTGNPTKNTGRFRECFEGGRFASRWNHGIVDSREVSLSSPKQIQEWAEDYGEDSDFFRVRVAGLFPLADAQSFISYAAVKEAIARIADVDELSGPVVLGVDVGRFGNDPSVIYPRCGIDAASRSVEFYYSLDTMTFASHVLRAADRYQARMVFVDSGGVGGGVVDRLIQLGVNVIPVDFGSGADGFNPENTGVKFGNKRAEIWGSLKTWLNRGIIRDITTGENVKLSDELLAPSYHLNTKEEIILESKRDMRRRGVASTNAGDALATTFAYPEMAEHVFEAAGVVVAAPKEEELLNYNPYKEFA